MWKCTRRAGVYRKFEFTFGDEALSERTVFNWDNELQFMRLSPSDNLREEKPVSVVTEERSLLSKKVTESHRITTSTTDVAITDIDNIFDNRLSIWKSCCFWMSHDLADGNKALNDARKQ